MSESTTTMDDRDLHSSEGAMGPRRGMHRSRRTGRGLMYVLAICLLMAAIAMAVAPVSGYKKGWAKYSHSNYLPPPQYGIPVPIKLSIWTGWIKGGDSIRTLLHAAAPTEVNQYVYVKDVQHGGLVATGLAMGFLLLSGLIGFLYLLLTLVFMCLRRPARPYPPGLSIVAIILGILNCCWSIAAYIVLAVGIGIESRRDLNATYVAWPDWCFFLAFFSGVFWLILGAIAWSANRKARRSVNQHDMAYKDNRPASTYNGTASTHTPNVKSEMSTV